MDNTSTDFEIMPQTKIGALLDRFPQLEPVLTEMAPQFKQLRNPILRKTIARVASLSQAAAMAKVSLTEMINRLRAEAGIQEEFASDLATDAVSAETPAWFSEDRIVKQLDARSMLEAGEHPVQRVLSECRDLKPGDIYELITPFLPAPLIEKAGNLGFTAWTKEEGEGVFKTYFTPKE
ncbi:MAG: DUF1858 domain-containing protein [Candidatus Aminicenantaceae bacterium]